MRGPVRGSDEGNRLRARRRQHEPETLFDGVTFDPGQAGRVRGIVRDQEPERLESDDESNAGFPGLACFCRCRRCAVSSRPGGFSSLTWAKELPTPLKTWEMSKLVRAGAIRQAAANWTRAFCDSPGISLRLVAKGYCHRVVLGVPLGFILGTSKTVHAGVRPDHCKSCGPFHRSPGCRWV